VSSFTHTHTYIYALGGMQVTDDVIYGVDMPRDGPMDAPFRADGSGGGWPWFGDEIELLIHAPPPLPPTLTKRTS
jgi:hypothetical protein